MNFLGNILATLFSTNKDHYEKISDYIDFEDILSPFIFYNDKSELISVIEIKTPISETFQIPFCLEFEKTFKELFNKGLHIQFFYAKQKGVLKNYAILYTQFNSEKHKETCLEFSKLIEKYKGESAFVRNDYFKKYLKYFADTSISPNELNKDETVHTLLDKKNYEIHVNHLKIGSTYYSVLTLAFDTRSVPIEHIHNELNKIDYHMSYRVENTMTKEETINKVVKVLSDEQTQLNTTACASTFHIKVWSNTVKELYEKINVVSRAFNYHGKTLYINNDDMFFDYINALPAVKKNMDGEIKIESINTTAYFFNLFKKT